MERELLLLLLSIPITPTTAMNYVTSSSFLLCRRRRCPAADNDNSSSCPALVHQYKSSFPSIILIRTLRAADAPSPPSITNWKLAEFRKKQWNRKKSAAGSSLFSLRVITCMSHYFAIPVWMQCWNGAEKEWKDRWFRLVLIIEFALDSEMVPSAVPLIASSPKGSHQVIKKKTEKNTFWDINFPVSWLSSSHRASSLFPNAFAMSLPEPRNVIRTFPGYYIQ